MKRYIIVSRHAGAVEWLRRRGIEGKVIPHVSSPDMIWGQHVVGNLPLHLAAEAATVTAIEFPDLPPEARGKDLTPEEMDAYGASLSSYRVVKLLEEE